MNRYVVLCVTVFLLPGAVFAAGDAASFESFYKAPWGIGWLIAAFAALAVVGLIIFTGGTASPLVASIGTLIGNAMGLSGAAATNAGLALLGGGSIASGGFGILGGTVVLTAALSFSTDVIIDYGVGKVVTEYRYRDLVAKSQDMPTLPLPSNTKGPKGYELAIEELERVNQDLPFHAESNLAVFRRAMEQNYCDQSKRRLAGNEIRYYGDAQDRGWRYHQYRIYIRYYGTFWRTSRLQRYKSRCNYVD